uniref:Ig-like domain-containing protein n=1 Tax=Lepeophtheirus salmonis TaxID=72036 RepID=A0A0K2SVD6_LEPSM
MRKLNCIYLLQVVLLVIISTTSSVKSSPQNLLLEYTETQEPSSSNRRQVKRVHYDSEISINAQEPLLGLQSTHPIILNQGEVFRAEVGESIRLPCHTNDLGPMILLWKKGTRVLTAGITKVRRDERMQLLGNDLEISELKKSDGGEYICELETDADLPSTITHTVEILVPPKLRTSPSNGQIVVKKGTTVSLTCHVTGNPEPVIKWEKLHERLPKGDIRVEERLSSTLTLSDVTRHHAGVYKCIADNGVGDSPVEQEIHLQVLYEPEAKPEQLQIHGGIGYQVELVCVVYAEPQADVLWYKDTMLLDSNGKRYMQQKGNRFTLLIKDVEKSDFGNYSCSASNMLGKSRTYLRVVGNPNTPVFNSHVTSKSPTSYKLSWITESYSRIEEYRLLYRRLPVSYFDIIYVYMLQYT